MLGARGDLRLPSRVPLAEDARKVHVRRAVCRTIAAAFRLKRDDFKLNRHHALASCLSMIFSENRFPLFGIML
jgi:hypothetical protein